MIKLIDDFLGKKGKNSQSYDFKILSKLFFDEMAKLLSEHDFIKRNGFGNSFVKLTSFGYQSVHFNIAKRESSFDVNPSLSIRFNKVEDLIDQCVLNRDKTFIGKNASCFQTLGQIYDKPLLQWKIKSDADVKRNSIKIYDLIVSKGFEFYENVQSIEDFFNFLNGKSSADCVASISDKAMYSMVSAHLLNDSKLFQETRCEWEDYFDNHEIPEKILYLGFKNNFENYLRSSP